jgi:hypothetical protein
MNEMTNQETDTALILENELKRRVKEVAVRIVHDIVREEMRAEFAKQKEAMLMEISITVGKHLRLIENDGRKPLWEATPEEFGLTRESIDSHHITGRELDAVREQTPPL